jgi:arabinosyltransferase C
MSTDASPDKVEELASSSVTDREGNHTFARWVATIAGLLGALLAIVTPVLPVNQTTAQLNWPQGGAFSSVEAPLIGYVATDLNISVPCQAAAGLAGPQNAAKTVLLSTVPKQAPKAVDRGLLITRANDELVLIVRNVPVVTAPLSQVLSPACQSLTFSAHADRVAAEFLGLKQGPNAEHPGSPLRGEKSSRCTSWTAPTGSGIAISCRGAGGRSAAWTPSSSPCSRGGTSSAPTRPTTDTS